MENGRKDSSAETKKLDSRQLSFAENKQQSASETAVAQHYHNRGTAPNARLSVSPSLGDELCAKIFEFVPVFDLLQHVALVCQQFSIILRRTYFWNDYGKILASEKMWQLYKQKQDWNISQLQQACAFATWNEQHPTKLCEFEECLLPTIREAKRLQKENRRACLASNTHHGNTESIEFTLSLAPRRAFTVSPGWWSSPPASSKHSSFENLLYLTSYPLSYVTRVRIKPLVDLFRGVLQVYAWEFTKITAYLLPMSLIEHADAADGRLCSCSFENNPDQSDSENMATLLKDQTPVYESAKIACKTIAPKLGCTDESQWVSHDLPVGVVANVVLITLCGKRARESLGYYACVDQVKVEGIPLLRDHAALVRRWLRLRHSNQPRITYSASDAINYSESEGSNYSDSDSDDDDDDDDDDGSMIAPADIWGDEDSSGNGGNADNDDEDDDNSVLVPANIVF